MVWWAITLQVSGGDIWLGLNLLELQFLLREMFWTHLRSKWLLFFAFCSTTSSGTIGAPCCRTRVGNYIALLRGYSIYIVVVFEEGIFYAKNCWGVLCTWPLIMLCLNRSRGVVGILVFDRIWNLDISRCPLVAEWGRPGDRKIFLFFFFFFLINNLLHSAWGQTVVATSITTYIRCTLTWSRRKEKEKEKRKKKEQIEKGKRKKKPNTIEI